MGGDLLLEKSAENENQVVGEKRKRRSDSDSRPKKKQLTAKQRKAILAERKLARETKAKKAEAEKKRKEELERQKKNKALKKSQPKFNELGSIEKTKLEEKQDQRDIEKKVEVVKSRLARIQDGIDTQKFNIVRVKQNAKRNGWREGEELQQVQEHEDAIAEWERKRTAFKKTTEYKDVEDYL